MKDWDNNLNSLFSAEDSYHFSYKNQVLISDNALCPFAQLFSPFKPGAKEATGSELTPMRPASKDPHSTFQQGVWFQVGKDLTVEIAMLWASTALHDDPLDLPHSIHIGAIATRYFRR